MLLQSRERRLNRGLGIAKRGDKLGARPTRVVIVVEQLKDERPLDVALLG
jgi:hypothetical protein